MSTWTEDALVAAEQHHLARTSRVELESWYTRAWPRGVRFEITAELVDIYVYNDWRAWQKWLDRKEQA